ncbi:MAG: DNA/RNA non-specific endonuclease [Bacteriovoracaceae bacterium]
MARLLVLLFLVSCATVPRKHGKLVDLNHTWFTVHYDPELRLPRYVEYTLEKKNLMTKLGKRKDHFHPDPILVKSGLPYATSDEYKKTGYDRGHLAPARDFSFSQEANDETFVMSNIAPQTKLLNRGAWLVLEGMVRQWACGEERLTIITGPIFTKNDPTLKSGLTIPQQFFKVIIDETPPRKTRAYVFHQRDPKNSTPEREVDPSEIELMTGITFPMGFPRGTSEWKSENCLPASLR